MPALRLSTKRGKLIAVLEAPDGRFTHRYVHSVHKTVVDELFVIEDATLRLYELRYDTTSTGMPSDAELGFRIEEGRFVLSMRRSFESIPIAVSPLPGHGIAVGDRFYPFAEWAKPGSTIVLTAGEGGTSGLP